MAKKKHSITPLGLSFLDCICCGFGAVLLLFILANGKQRNQYRQAIDTNDRLTLVQEQYQHVLDALRIKQKNQGNLRQQKGKELTGLIEQIKAQQSRPPEFQADAPASLNIPNPVNRQYLTDFKRDGEHVLILIEASGGMLDFSVEEARIRSRESPSTKRRAPKWQNAIKAAEWVLAQLQPPTRYQVYPFNRTAQSILPATTASWLDLKDHSTLTAVINSLRTFTPEQGANLERAFLKSREFDPLPDNIILITDGLPTLSDSLSAGAVANPATRRRMFEVAERQLPIATPVNTLLLPMSGDPDAAAYYWRLACRTNGSFICPARDWPAL